MSELFSSTSSKAEVDPGRSGRGWRRATWLLPLALFGGFALLFGLLFRDRLLSAKAVNVTPALVIEESLAGDSDVPSDEMLFQASGWIEPDPLPIKATALQDGVIDEVSVLEGQEVRKGEVLATLVDIDTKLARDSAEANLKIAKSSFDAHCVETQVQLQNFEAENAGLVSDRARLEEAIDRLKRLDESTDASAAEEQRVRARLNRTRKEAAVEKRKARIQAISEDFNRIAYEASAMEARVRAAEIGLEQAKLAHERTRILSPVDGRVLRLLAAPGQKKMLAMDDVDSATIAILYQPAHLQVRVDVPLADASGLSVGQRARVRCSLLPNQVFGGVVTRITGEADLQRNTLQAKVRIDAPDEKLRPEMLCRVEFLDTATNDSKSSNGLSIYVPESAIQAGNILWVYDPETHRADRRAVTTGSEKREGYRRIKEGIRPGEQVILNSENLRPGQRVNPLKPNP